MDRFCKWLLDYGYPLDVGKCFLGGEGGELIARACRDSRIVVVGEDHGTAEIPAFVKALSARWLEPGTLSTLAIETGCITASFLAGVAASQDPMAVMSQAIGKYGRFVPFYDSREELDLLSACSAGGASLVGIDHEFLHAAGMLMEALKAEVLAVLPTEDLRWCERQFREQSGCAGEKPGSALLLCFEIETLMSLYEVAVRAGPFAERLASELVRSYMVYVAYLNGQKRRSAATRINLLCRALWGCLRPSQLYDGVPYTLVKIGYNHGFREMNLEGLADLGSFIQQLGCQLKVDTLHIVVIGARGTRLKLSGLTTVPCVEDFSLASDDRGHFEALAPILASKNSGGAKVFDLRALRKLPEYPAALTNEERHLVMGYDLLVLFPSVSAAQVVL